jgi:peptidoglycan/xylan/chitin deacetylase (PgdA/CDA1 family)
MLNTDSSYILFFHRILPGNLDIFSWQMEFLKKNKNIASIYEIENLKPGSVIITFDDGFFDNFVYAYPILSKYNIPATIFLSTAYLKETGVRKTLNDYYNEKITLEQLQQPGQYDFKKLKSDEFLTWEEVNVMLRSGLISFESHGFTHFSHFIDNKLIDKNNNNLRKLKYLNFKYSGNEIYKTSSIFKGKEYLVNEDRFETDTERENRLFANFNKSMELLQQHTCKKPQHFCWPWGEYDKFAINIGKKTGFKYFYTTNKGTIQQSFNNWDEIPRISASFNKKTFLKRDYVFSRKKFADFYLKFFN